MKLWPFSKKHTNYLKTDLHSHLLPGIDDGVRTLDESLYIIEKLSQIGYQRLITTPHIMLHRYPNTKDSILQRLEYVQKAIYAKKIKIDIVASAEYYLDNHFLDLLAKDELLTFGNKCILFETDYHEKPLMLEQAVFEMCSKGYTPILAHPERYIYLRDDMELYYQLKDMGILFQVNLKSLRNTRSPLAKTTKALSKAGLIDFIGSDIHRIKDVDEYVSLVHKPYMRKICNENSIKNHRL